MVLPRGAVAVSAAAETLAPQPDATARSVGLKRCVPLHKLAQTRVLKEETETIRAGQRISQHVLVSRNPIEHENATVVDRELKHLLEQLVETLSLAPPFGT